MSRNTNDAKVKGHVRSLARHLQSHVHITCKKNVVKKRMQDKQKQNFILY